MPLRCDQHSAPAEPVAPGVIEIVVGGLDDG